MMEKSEKKSKLYARWFLIRLALVVFDILAVNIAYISALVIRFYVASEFNEWAVKYIPAFMQFAPYYTVACLVVFFLFQLYNSRWKYAGLNDLNRIALANLVTFVIQVAGSVLFVMRMPITYYFIGAIVQFALIAVSRFSYRFFLIERDRVRKMRNKTNINVMVVGVGETSRIVIKHLESDVDNAAHPVCVVDFRGEEFGSRISGIPVVSGVDKIAGAVKKYSVESVILADTLMPQTLRRQIRETCKEAGVEVQDFSGYFQDNRGNVSLRSLMEYVNGPVELVMNGQTKAFDNAEQAMLNINGKYLVSGVSAKGDRLVVTLQKDVLVPNDVQADWVQDYQKETGNDISFF